MEKALFIFKHDKRFHIGKDSLYLLIYSVFVILVILFEVLFDFNFGTFTILISIIWVLSLMIFSFSRFFLYELEFGKYEGKLILKPESIVINEEEFKIEKIQSIEINALDFKGKTINWHNDFSRMKSNGLDNFIRFKMEDGTSLTTYFFQTKANKIQLFKDELINYYKLGKISWLHLIDILEITDYDKIQAFKKELNN